MALSARTRLTVTLPDGSSQDLRMTTDGQTPPTCATCGKPAPAHIFRPKIGCRCADCLEMVGKADLSEPSE